MYSLGFLYYKINNNIKTINPIITRPNGDGSSVLKSYISMFCDIIFPIISNILYATGSDKIINNKKP
jgi:hypothetical protein